MIFLGGFTGSELWTTSSPARWVWPNPFELALGLEGQLRLDRDRRSPGPPDGVRLTPYQVVYDYYRDCLDALRPQLQAIGWTLELWAYDWRLSYLDSGAQLAARCQAVAEAQGPVSIVAHSFGGLVARGAWRSLGLAGRHDAVRRIVTIATGHQGTYQAARFISEGDPSLNGLLSLTRLAAAASYLPVIDPRSRAWTIGELLVLATTWPSLLELLPVLGSPDSHDDPSRPELYDPATWPAYLDLADSPLAYVRDVSGPLLIDPSTVPPYEVLTTVSGYGWTTTSGRAAGGQLGPRTPWLTDGLGDTMLTRESAEVADSRVFRRAATHGDLPNLLGPDGQLLDMAVEDRSGGGPPLPPELLGQSSLAIAGPYPYDVRLYPRYVGPRPVAPQDPPPDSAPVPTPAVAPVT